MPGLVEPEMRSYLEGAGTSATNFFLKVAPQRTVSPFGIIFKIDSGEKYTHDGGNLYEATIQCSCFADTYVEVKELAVEVIEAMENWVNVEDDVQAVFLVNELDLFEDDTDMPHVALDFIVWHVF